MATSGAYKRGKSGYSVKDEKDARSYKEVNRKTSIERMGQTGSIVRSKKDVAGSVGNAEYNWKSNTKTPRGREVNALNMKDSKEQLSIAEADRKRLARKK